MIYEQTRTFDESRADLLQPIHCQLALLVKAIRHGDLRDAVKMAIQEPKPGTSFQIGREDCPANAVKL